MVEVILSLINSAQTVAELDIIEGWTWERSIYMSFTDDEEKFISFRIGLAIAEKLGLVQVVE